jgi:hypothetical protein
VVLQAFIDDSYRIDGLFVLGGYVASAEAWAEFSREWAELLPELGVRQKYGPPRFKMSEMARLRIMERVPHFYRIIEKHALFSLACKIDLAELEQAKSRIWIDGMHIEWGFLDNYFLTSWRFLLDNFHQIRVSAPALPPEDQEYLRRVVSILAPTDTPIDFYFDDHSSKSAVISGWDAFVAGRLEHVRALYGATPRFESDDAFLPLQAADFWAWWVRKGFEEDMIDRIGCGDFPTWQANRQIPSIILAPTEDQMVNTIIAMARTIIGPRHAIYDGNVHPRPPQAPSLRDNQSFLRAFLGWFLGR